MEITVLPIKAVTLSSFDLSIPKKKCLVYFRKSVSISSKFVLKILFFVCGAGWESRMEVKERLGLIE